jgi:serine/threonine protein kinase
MEFADGGKLETFINDRNGRPITEDDLLRLFIPLIIPVQYIHEYQVIHCGIQSLFEACGSPEIG